MHGILVFQAGLGTGIAPLSGRISFGDYDNDDDGGAGGSGGTIDTDDELLGGNNLSTHDR